MTTLRHPPECHRCQLFTSSNYIICAIHPEGIQGNPCLDFCPDPDVEQEQMGSYWISLIVTICFRKNYTHCDRWSRDTTGCTH